MIPNKGQCWAGRTAIRRFLSWATDVDTARSVSRILEIEWLCSKATISLLPLAMTKFPRSSFYAGGIICQHTNWTYSTIIGWQREFCQLDKAKNARCSAIKKVLPAFSLAEGMLAQIPIWLSRVSNLTVGCWTDMLYKTFLSLISISTFTHNAFSSQWHRFIVIWWSVGTFGE